MAKYNQRAEQNKIIDRQIIVLKLSARQAAVFKTVSFYYINKALVIVNANMNSDAYSLYWKIEPLKAEHEGAISSCLRLFSWMHGRKYGRNMELWRRLLNNQCNNYYYILPL